MGILKKDDEFIAQASSVVDSSATVITKDCSITGNIKSECDIYIDGVVDGHIEVKKVLTVTQSGLVHGDIFANRLVINGVVEGNCYVNVLEIHKKGKMHGAIYTNDLSIEKGGQFNGKAYPSEGSSIVELAEKKREIKKPIATEKTRV